VQFFFNLRNLFFECTDDCDGRHTIPQTRENCYPRYGTSILTQPRNTKSLDHRSAGIVEEQKTC
ncbi:MAG: hypothetical protein Q3W98_08020, partial [Collinsella sp.]|nr:hypothetical protein [Collinsella sp.]